MDPENHQCLMETSLPTPFSARVYVNLPEGIKLSWFYRARPCSSLHPGSRNPQTASPGTYPLTSFQGGTSDSDAAYKLHKYHEY